jgi:hypothetical protein
MNAHVLLPPAPATGRFRLHRVLLTLVALAVALLCGCIGRREALEMSNSLVRSSTEAARSIEALHLAAKAETNAHAQTRQTLQDLHTAWFSARLDLTRAQVDAAFQRTLLRITQERAEAERALQTGRQNLHASLESQLKESLAPLDEKVKALLQTSRDSAAKTAQAPGDLRLRAESAEADRAYTAALGRKIEIDRDAWRQALAELGQLHHQAGEQLAKAAARHVEEARRIHDRAQQSFAQITPTPLALGEPPRVNSDTYLALLEYQEAVKDAGQAMKDYLVLNSFGKGSFFDVFLRSVGKGFLQNVPFIGGGKGVQWSEVKDAGSVLLRDAGTAARENLEDAANTASAALRDTATDGLASLKTKLTATLDRISASALGKLGGDDR